MLEGARDAIVRFWHTRIHFIELHYLYFACLIFVASGLLYCQPGTDWKYIDALFMATTAATNTGLNTIAMSDLSTYQMLLLFFLSLFGSQITISYAVVIVRRHYFSKRFEDILKFNKARRQREEQRRKERRKKDSTDIELGHSPTKQRRRLSLYSAATTTAATRRRMSLSSIASTPVSGSKGHGGRGKSSWLSKPHEISSFLQQFRNEQKKMMDRREAEAKANNDAGGFELQRQTSSPMHPCQEHDKYPNELDRVTSPSSTMAGNSSSRDFSEENAGTQGIAFANNIEQQREIARRRLEQERRFEELMQKIAWGDPISDTLLDSDDDEEFEEIMRQPIDKSQLTRQQRYRLGGAEYRAIDMLARIVPIYYFGFIIVAAFMIRGYIGVSSYAQQVLQTSNPTGPVDPWFFSFFTAVSGMDNLGMCHLDASLVPFQNAPFPLLVVATLILVGNTAYAILLRFVIWVLYRLTPRHETMRRETFQYLLDHPRRCYTLLFPSTQTWWLLIVLVCITIAELVCFIAFNYWLPVTVDLTWGSRILDGLFQSIATRSAGFSVINLADLNPGTQLVYIIAMYISVYPVAISMRNSNVYQERALGIFRGEDEEPVQFTEADLRGPAPFIKLRRHPTISSVMTHSKRVLRGPDFFVLTQIQRQLTSDICWVIAGIFCISVLEATNIMSPSPVTLATVIYECVSAFGNVGASTGYPNTSTSQSAVYRTVSKLVIIVLMYRGRHRGLPSAIDRAVLLPSEQLEQSEADEQQFKRRNTSFTTGAPSFTNGAKFYTRSSTL